MSNPGYGESKTPFPQPGQPGYGEAAPPPYGTPVQGQPSGTMPQAYQPYQQSAHQGVPHVVYTNPPVMLVGPAFALGPVPSRVECPNCKNTVVTEIQYQNGSMTWLLVGGLLLFGCWLGCCLIPTCVDDCKDVLHKCPNCKQYVGRYSRL